MNFSVRGALSLRDIGITESFDVGINLNDIRMIVPYRRTKPLNPTLIPFPFFCKKPSFSCVFKHCPLERQKRDPHCTGKPPVDVVLAGMISVT